MFFCFRIIAGLIRVFARANLGVVRHALGSDNHCPAQRNGPDSTLIPDVSGVCQQSLKGLEIFPTRLRICLTHQRNLSTSNKSCSKPSLSTPTATFILRPPKILLESFP